MPTAKCTWGNMLEPGLRAIFEQEYGDRCRLQVSPCVDSTGIEVNAYNNKYAVGIKIARELVEDERFDVITEMIKNLAKKLRYEQDNDINIPVMEIKQAIEPDIELIFPNLHIWRNV